MAGFELGDGVRKVFLAGIGAIAATAEKGQKLVNDLVDKGELTVDQGKSFNSELAHRVKEKTGVVRDAALEGRMKLMSDEERAEFVRKVNEFAHGAAAADSKETAEQR
ncbi:MAG: phasin family protein [Aeriscardovia sp.]|nr:phasin family protein [Aeriscardovia sp.]